jgi:hypothetical protein
MKNIIVNLVSLVVNKVLWVTIINGEKVVAESWYHKELLHHRIHIANATKVFEANVFLSALDSVARRRVVPSIVPLDHAHQRKHAILQESFHQ